MSLRISQVVTCFAASAKNGVTKIEKEYALKAGTDIVTDFTKQTVEALYSTESVKQELNKQTFNSFKNKKSSKKGKK